MYKEQLPEILDAILNKLYDEKLLTFKTVETLDLLLIEEYFKLKLTVPQISHALDFLEKEGYIEQSYNDKNGNQYLLTIKGIQLKHSGGYAKQLATEERNEHYKNLQVQDLETKLNIMNAEQRDFWKAQKQKNCQTTLMAIISALFSLFAMLKTFGVFDKI